MYYNDLFVLYKSCIIIFCITYIYSGVYQSKKLYEIFGISKFSWVLFGIMQCIFSKFYRDFFGGICRDI